MNDVIKIKHLEIELKNERHRNEKLSRELAEAQAMIADQNGWARRMTDADKCPVYKQELDLMKEKNERLNEENVHLRVTLSREYNDSLESLKKNQERLEAAYFILKEALLQTKVSDLSHAWLVNNADTAIAKVEGLRQ